MTDAFVFVFFFLFFFFFFFFAWEIFNLFFIVLIRIISCHLHNLTAYVLVF